MAVERGVTAKFGAGDRARRRVKVLGREASIAHIPNVPLPMRDIFAQAIMDEFPVDLGALGPIREAEGDVGLAGAELATPGALEEGAPGLRSAVSQANPLVKFGFEAGPSILGAVGGALTPVPIIGSAIGGFLGEEFAQRAGFAPPSKINKALALLGPPVVRGAVGGTRVAARFFTRFPFVKDAIKQIAESSTFIAARQLGPKILAKGQGFIQKTANDLYAALRAVQGKIGPDDMPGTMTVLREVEQKVGKFARLEPATKLLNTIEDFRGVITEGIDFDDLTAFRRIIGQQVGDLERVGGPRIRGVKDIFSTMLDDVERMARRAQGIKPNDTVFGFATGAELFEAAPKRAKLEWAVSDLNEIVERWSKGIAGGGAEQRFFAKEALDSLRAITRKGSPQFDKNFTEALKGELKDLFNFFETANRIEGSLVKGPGRLIVAGRVAKLGEKTAGFVAGGAIGMAPGGMIGLGLGTVGALAGVQLPAQMTKLLLRPAGRKLILRLLEAGEGKLTPRALALIGTAAAQFGKNPDLRETFLKGAATSNVDIAREQFQQRFQR